MLVMPVEWVLPAFIMGFLAAMHTASLERTSVGAVGAAFDFSVIERCLIASRALLFYPFKLLIPHPLIFTYRGGRSTPVTGAPTGRSRPCCCSPQPA